MGMGNEKRKRGRRAFTPLEAMYYKRFEVTLLIGIYLEVRARGGTLGEAIDKHAEHLGLPPYDNTERKCLNNAVTIALGEMKGVLKLL